MILGYTQVMSILILGAAGNLGGQLRLVFVDQKPVSWDRVDFDFLDFGELSRRLQILRPTIIINAAAYNSVDKCEQEEGEAALAWSLNRDLPAALADYCLSAGALLIHYSTDYVFGGDQRLSGAYNELDHPSPLSVYGQSKYGGEQALARSALKGLNYYLIRTSKLFGPPGENSQAKPSFFDIMLSLAAKGEKIRAIDGEMSCFTYTPDLALATRQLCDEQVARGIYHLVNTGPATWYQGAQYLFQIAGIETDLQAITSAEWPRPAIRPAFSVLANNRRRPLRSWQEALVDYLLILKNKA